MDTHYAWRGAGLGLVLCLMVLVMAASCGGGGLKVDNGGQQVSESAGGPAVATSRTITEDEIASLPGWQQELLADPGWNQPPIPQRAETPMPAPSHEQLLQWQEQALADGIQVALRTPEGGKGASYVLGKQDLSQVSINRAEYNIDYDPDPSATVPYGCKDSSGTNGHMKEKKLALLPFPTEATIPITYVEKGVAAGNHFSGAGGTGSDALCAVYQLWCSTDDSDPPTDAA